MIWLPAASKRTLHGVGGRVHQLVLQAAAVPLLSVTSCAALVVAVLWPSGSYPKRVVRSSGSVVLMSRPAKSLVKSVAWLQRV